MSKEDAVLEELLGTTPATVTADGQIILALPIEKPSEVSNPAPPEQTTSKPKLRKPITKSLGVEEMIHRANLYRANLADS